MTYELAEKLIDDIIEKRKLYLSDKNTKTLRGTFYASDIRECEKYLVHSIVDAGLREPVNEFVQALFESGKDQERLFVRDLLNLGYDIEQQQKSFEIKNSKGIVICRGKIDGMIRFKGKAIPFEIKSMDSQIFKNINDYDDLDRTPFLKKYKRQLQLYLYGNEYEAGLLLLTDCRGHWKPILVTLNYEECELVLKKMEKAWSHVENKTYPDQNIESNECEKCPFKHVCLPPTTYEGVNIIENEELLNCLHRRQELKPLYSEYDRLDKTIKKKFKEIPECYVYDKYCIKGKPVKRKDYTVEESEYWKTEIISLQKSDHAGEEI